MKKLFTLLFGVLLSVGVFAQSTDATLLGLSTIVKTNPPSSAKTGAALDAIINSKINFISAYTASGTDTYVVSVNPGVVSYISGQCYDIRFTNGNTGAATLNTNGLGAKAIKKNVSDDLESGDINAGSIHRVFYDGTNFQINIGGSGGHVIQTDGVPLAAQPNLNFTGGLTASDDAGNSATKVILGGTLLQSTEIATDVYALVISSDDGAGATASSTFASGSLEMNFEESGGSINNVLFNGQAFEVGILDVSGNTSNIIQTSNQVQINAINDATDIILTGLSILPTAWDIAGLNQTTGDDSRIVGSVDATNSIVISSTNALFEGLQYDADYSANFTDRSLIDKGFADATYATAGSSVTGSGTANQIAYWTSTTAIGALTTATYPSLTELSYVKGVTSSIQTQLGTKWSLLTGGTQTGNNDIVGTGFTLKFTNNGQNETATDGSGMLLANTTAATLATQQYSPSLTFEGQGWSTTGSITRNVRFQFYVDTNIISSVSEEGALVMRYFTQSTGSYTVGWRYSFAPSAIFNLTGALTATGAIQGTTVFATSISGFGIGGGILGVTANTGATRVEWASGSYRTKFIGPTNTTLNTAKDHYGFSGSFVDPANSALGRFMAIEPTYNLTSANTSDVVGLDYNPTVTSVLGKHIAATWRTGAFVIGHTTVTTNTTKLQVRGNGTTTGSIALFENSAGTERFKVLDNGTLTVTGGSSLHTISGGYTTLAAEVIGNISELITSITNTSPPSFTLKHTTSATPAAGIGVALSFETETSSANNEIGTIIESVTTDVTGGSEDFDIVFKSMAAGSAANEKLRITSDGRLYGTALHNNAGAVTGTTNQYVASGTYTPTLFNTTNVGASTPYASQWIRVGNVVTVSGKVDIDPTAAAATELGMSIPIASGITVEEDLAGSSGSQVATTVPVRVRGDATNDRASFVFTAVSTSNDSYSFTFTYLIK